MGALLRCLILTVAALAGVASAGCGPQQESAVEVAVIGSRQPVISDPSATALEAPGRELLASVAQGLVRFDARGQIEPGLAERWNVSNDGLSYIFRLVPGDWPDGRPINARDVARILGRQLRSDSRNPLKDTLGAVAEIVPMTDRVIEIRLNAPRPNLLQLLAQPEMAIVREGLGTGPFQPDPKPDVPGAMTLSRTIRVIDGKDEREHIHLRTLPAPRAVSDFTAGKSALVLGGSFVDLPVARRARLERGALRFDPVAGLFGLAPGRRSGPIADKAFRTILNQAIDRDALIAALAVPGLVPRATLLQVGLEGGATPSLPAWASEPLAERRARLAVEAKQLIGSEAPTRLAVALPEGPGADLLLARLSADWAPLGVRLERAGRGVPADLKLIDRVAPSTSPAWFVRTFRCSAAPICSEAADGLMDSARDTPIALQRAALLAEAGRLVDEESLFLPLAAPIRWSLVSDRIAGFAENIFARHPLTGLGEKLSRER